VCFGVTNIAEQLNWFELPTLTIPSKATPVERFDELSMGRLAMCNSIGVVALAHPANFVSDQSKRGHIST
jgi:hypothetical protein